MLKYVNIKCSIGDCVKTFLMLTNDEWKNFRDYYVEHRSIISSIIFSCHLKFETLYESKDANIYEMLNSRCLLQVNTLCMLFIDKNNISAEVFSMKHEL